MNLAKLNGAPQLQPQVQVTRDNEPPKNPNTLGVIASSYGMGIPDFWKARAYFELAIVQQIPQGEFNLARNYEFAQGYIINDTHKQLYIDAAKEVGLDDRTIHYNLGVSYLTGHGADQNLASASKHLLEAQRLQHPYAEQRLQEIGQNGVQLP